MGNKFYNTWKTVAVARDNRDNPVEATAKTGATFQINDTKIHVPVVTLSINHNIKFLKH